MTAPTATTCNACLGDRFVVVEQRGTDVEVPCPSCGPCDLCGQTTDTPPMCLACDADDDDRYRRRIDA